jgi:hypothetical protein
MKFKKEKLVKGAGLFGLDTKLIVNQSNPRRRSALAGSRKVGDRQETPRPPVFTISEDAPLLLLI